jgi:1,4-alpha-glucan branching enzyme
LVAVADDPYRFWPTLGDVDLHLIGEGTHRRLWDALGAHARRHEGVDGTAFAVWAPAARSVRVVGDFNGWNGRAHPMRLLGSSGVWELFVPGAGPEHHYKFEVNGSDGRVALKADPLARAAELPPGAASIITTSSHVWGDGVWIDHRLRDDPVRAPLTIYEVHLGSWRPGLGYREIAPLLADHVIDLGFTHVELLPIAEHPFGGSWGYQVSSYYAPTARYGTPDDFRWFVDHLHQRGIGVIIDWVPAHFPRDAWALGRFDGSALYEHLDPRLGEHPDWGTFVFNYARNEVRNFLVANALYWVDEFHVDGLRVDAVASMIYLDYSRQPGQWVPNERGGRENLGALQFIRDLNVTLHGAHPGVLTVAEESTSWPAVTAPVHHDGLGFTHKWNMGWMHDTLDYLRHDPVHRKHHHRNLTFGLLYAYTENFVLPLSHDEVVHGKGPLIDKMAGDKWQKFANLRALYGWMWAYPGRKLLFMGSEIAQDREWHHDRSLDWHLLDRPEHAGVRDLVRQLNHVLLAEPALWERDRDPAGFRWLDADDSEHSIYSFVRYSGDGRRAVACVANFTPVPREGYRLGVPFPGHWTTLLDTNATWFGGSGYGGSEGFDTERVAWHGFGDSALISLPPLAVVWFAGSTES